MLFNSVEYLVFFLPIVFTIYWGLANDVKAQNILLLISSYIFYGLWDYRFLSLIIISSFTDFVIGISIDRSSSNKVKKVLLFISLLVNIGFLVSFKYYNFFLDGFTDLLNQFDISFNVKSLEIILPVGISFYTFQTLSYSIDVYRGKLKPTKSIINFFTYVAFFPQLVAGPIERAINLLPQIERNRTFSKENAKLGLRQILWGLFKKVAIADNCAVLVDPIFNDPSNFDTTALISGAVLFALQIYCDFSGYSDIAIGTAKLLGIKLMQNFAFPYFARDIAEFWRRWHISLSTWFRDYVYIPLGGSRVGKFLQIRNVFAIFLVSGFWHGANWTFIFWGFIHALCYIPQVLLNTNRKNVGTIAQSAQFPGFLELFKIARTFLIVTFAWIFFRAESISSGVSYLEHIFTNGFEGQNLLESKYLAFDEWLLLICFIVTMMIFEWFNRMSTFGIEKLPKLKLARYIIYVSLCLVIIQYLYGSNEFIYFQF